MAVRRRKPVTGKPAAATRAPAAATADPGGLEAALGHRFRDRGLLQAALEHSSLGAQRRTSDFDRLEFLGDRVVGLAVAELLLAQYPDDDEGAIARRHAQLVNRDSLARIARAIDLGAYLRLSISEARAGGGNPGVLSDALEALVAALYRDGGLKAAQRFLAGHFAPLIAGLAVPPRDAKTALQEWAQGRALGLPAYRALSMTGPAHKPRIVVEVSLAGFAPATAEGPSKRTAEQAAAAALLARVQAKS